jgi:hypothetical protein
MMEVDINTGSGDAVKYYVAVKNSHVVARISKGDWIPATLADLGHKRCTKAALRDLRIEDHKRRMAHKEAALKALEPYGRVTKATCAHYQDGIRMYVLDDGQLIPGIA